MIRIAYPLPDRAEKQMRFVVMQMTQETRLPCPLIHLLVSKYVYEQWMILCAAVDCPNREVEENLILHYITIEIARDQVRKLGIPLGHRTGKVFLTLFSNFIELLNNG